MSAGETRMPPSRIARAIFDGLDAHSAAPVRDVNDLVRERRGRGRRVQHGVDRMATRGFHRSGETFGREDQRRQLVVLARISDDQRAPSDVVQVPGKRDVPDRAADVRCAATSVSAIRPTSRLCARSQSG